MSRGPGFFVTEGTLDRRASCYISRKADRELVDALARGEFAYVLDSRQKGKSSIMIRTREALEAAGERTVLLDLQRFGSNLDAERWYASLLAVVGEQLGLEDRLFEMWNAQLHAGPMRKFFGAVEKALEELNISCVIFVDEIDFVRSLPFSTDEFFAGIRECHNRRASGTAGRLTFCLLGVATPSELIRDVRITPFNVGHRIELTDFTLEELSTYQEPLSDGGRNGASLLKRIHYWTGGHPYLTQKVAAAVGADPLVRAGSAVDRLVEAMFFSIKARSEEPNLSDVSRRVLESPIEGVSVEEARSRVLDTYQRVREGRVRDDETDPVASVLKLSGLTSVKEGYLGVRNRIYLRAFDHAWVQANLPVAEAVRQRRAAKRASLRVALITASVAAAIAVLAIFGFLKDHEAREAGVRALAQSQARNLAERARESADSQAKVAMSARADADRKAAEAAKAVIARDNALATATAETKRANSEKLKALAATQKAIIAEADAKRANSATLAAKREGDKNRYQTYFSLVDSALEGRQFGQAQDLLREAAKPLFSEFRGPEWGWWNYRLNTQLLTLDGHDGPLLGAVFTPDGNGVWTGSSRGIVKLWDQSSGRLRREFKCDKDPHSFQFSKSCRLLVSTREDGVASVWNSSTGGRVSVLVGHTKIINRVMFSPDEKLIATASFDGTARIWDVKTGRQMRVLRGHRAPISEASFSPDGTRIVTASDDSTVRVWNAGTGQQLLVLQGHSGKVWGADYFPDGKRIFSEGEDGVPRIWNATTGSELAVLKGYSDSILGCDISPDGHIYVSASNDGTARVWDTASGNEIAVLRGHTGPVINSFFSPDGTRIVTWSGDGTVRVWQAATGSEILAFRGFAAPINFAMFSPDGTHILTSSQDGTAKIWDARCSRDFLNVSFGSKFVYDAEFAQGGNQIVTGGADQAVRLIDARTGLQSLMMSGHRGIVYASMFSPDGKKIVTGGEDSTVRIWDTSSGRFLSQLRGSSSSVWYASFSPDGKRVLASSDDGTARIWDLKSRKVSWLVKVPNGAKICSSLFSPDGSRVVAGLSDKTARVWDVYTGRTVLTLAGHYAAVYSAQFSPDGSRIVTVSADRTAKVWESRSGRKVCDLIGHSDAVNYGAFSPDSKEVVTASDDGTARVWDASTGVALYVLRSKDKQNVANFSPDGSVIVTAGAAGSIRINPLGYDAARRLTFIQQSTWVCDQLALSASYGDVYAWHWQIRNWAKNLDVRKPELRQALVTAKSSPNGQISAEAAALLGGQRS